MKTSLAAITFAIILLSVVAPQATAYPPGPMSWSFDYDSFDVDYDSWIFTVTGTVTNDPVSIYTFRKPTVYWAYLWDVDQGGGQHNPRELTASTDIPAGLEPGDSWTGTLLTAQLPVLEMPDTFYLVNWKLMVVGDQNSHPIYNTSYSIEEDGSKYFKTPVPEPSAFAAFAMGMVSLIGIVLKRRN